MSALPPSVKLNPRGLGTDNSPGCFICGGEHGSHRNFAAFVSSKEEGEVAVEIIGKGARLDFRESEPGWIQVKVGACEAHLRELELLQAVLHGNHLTPRLLELVVGPSLPAVPEVVTCPECSMAIYDDAAKAGLCAACEPEGATS